MKNIQTTTRILKKKEMNHDGIEEKNWREKKDVWHQYVKNDVLCTALSYRRYRKAVGEITSFELKDCLS